MSDFFTKLASWDKIALVNPMVDSIALGYAAPGSTGSRLSGRPLDTSSYLINRKLYSGPAGLAARVRADEMIAERMVGNIADQGNSAVNAVIGEATKKYKKYKDLPKSRKALSDLVKNDDIISRADPKDISSLYKTMYDVAPNMTKHKEAVRAFLRQGLMHEGGIDPTALGQLARSEAALTGKPSGRLD